MTMSNQGHDATRALRGIQQGSQGYVGVAIMTLCAFILGAGSLYQALRVHQKEVNQSRLQGALKLFAETGPVSPNHPPPAGRSRGLEHPRGRRAKCWGLGAVRRLKPGFLFPHQSP